MRFMALVPRRSLDEALIVHFTIYDGQNFKTETRASITTEVTPEFIQELRDTADKAEKELAKRDKELAIRAAIEASEKEGAA